MVSGVQLMTLAHPSSSMQCHPDWVFCRYLLGWLACAVGVGTLVDDKSLSVMLSLQKLKEFREMVLLPVTVALGQTGQPAWPKHSLPPWSP